MQILFCLIPRNLLGWSKEVLDLDEYDLVVAQIILDEMKRKTPAHDYQKNERQDEYKISIVNIFIGNRCNVSWTLYFGLLFKESTFQGSVCQIDTLNEGEEGDKH